MLKEKSGQTVDSNESASAEGTQLNELHIEVLEEIFKRVQFEQLNLENANLTDNAVVALCDMVEFYESCTELTLARNSNITSVGWNAVTRLVRKLPGLKWLDLRYTTLAEVDIELLSHNIRSQALYCRTVMNDFRKFQLARHQSNSTANETKATPTACSDSRYPVGFDMPFSGLRGLHMGGTSIRNGCLSHLLNSIRLSYICDLRLPDNHLGPSDTVFLIPLLRYGASLRYLDLSNNEIEDEGCKIISDALTSTALDSSSSNLSKCGLYRLNLANNQLSEASMATLGCAIARCPHLTCLQLYGNCKISCSGLLYLQPGLIHSRQLRRLGLAHCGIQCVGTVALTEVLMDKPRRLKVIDLTGNQIGSAGLLALLRYLEHADCVIEIPGIGNPTSATLKLNGQLSYPLSSLTNQQNSVSELSDLYQKLVVQLNGLLELHRPQYPHMKPIISTRYSCVAFPPESQKSVGAEPLERMDPRYFWGDSSDDEEQQDGLTDDIVFTSDNDDYTNSSTKEIANAISSPSVVLPDSDQCNEEENKDSVNPASTSETTEECLLEPNITCDSTKQDMCATDSLT